MKYINVNLYVIPMSLHALYLPENIVYPSNKIYITTFIHCILTAYFHFLLFIYSIFKYLISIFCFLSDFLYIAFVFFAFQCNFYIFLLLYLHIIISNPIYINIILISFGRFYLYVIPKGNIHKLDSFV